jgi:hypothetical protein
VGTLATEHHPSSLVEESVFVAVFVAVVVAVVVLVAVAVGVVVPGTHLTHAYVVDGGPAEASRSQLE